MNARDIRTLYVHELRSALRERNIVVYSLLIPAILYPLLIWLTWTAASFVSGKSEGQVSRIVALEIPAAHARLIEELKDDPQVEIRAITGSPEAALRAEEADAVVALEPLGGGAGAEAGAGPGVRIQYDGSKERSVIAKDRVNAAALRYRDALLKREAEARGVTKESFTPLRVVAKNEASGKEMGAFLLKLVVPLLLLVMTSMGCFYPAVDATAGERERGTWETLMATAPSRISIMVAKYLYVATLGCAAGLLNLAGMFISMGAIFASALARAEGDIRVGVPLASIPLMILCAVLIALFVAAAMMILASFARTFKEGQAMITPFYLGIALPALILQSPDVELTTGLALIPLANVTMMFREAIAGSYKAPLIGLTLAVQVVAIALLLLLASRLTRFEDAIVSSPRAAVLRRLRQLLRGNKKGG